MTSHVLTITNAGLAALPSPDGLGLGPVTISHFGVSASAMPPAATAVPNEIKRLDSISGTATGANQVHISIRDESPDAYLLRTVALYLSTGTLFGFITSDTPIFDKASGSVMMIAVDLDISATPAENISFTGGDWLNPTATETMAGVIRLATVAQAVAGIDHTRAVTPRGLLASLQAYLATWGAGIWRASNDGAGSGMDSDLLDGQQGSWYADIIPRLGWTPVQQGGGTGQGNNKIRLGASGGRLRAQIDNTDLGNIVHDSQIADVWRASNDGAGSALDAGLLCGRPDTDFTLAADFSSGGNINNWWSLMPGGRLECGGRVHCARDQAVVVTYLKTFSEIHHWSVTAQNNNANIDNGGSVITFNNTQATLARTSTSNSQTHDGYIFWRVLGKA
ncbi:MAG: hypothetical protein QM645_11420 [Asticcacaulis sp.]